MANRYSIRPATVADVGAMALAERRCFSDPWSAEALAALFEQDTLVALIGERDGVLTGYLLARAILDEAEVLNIAVLPEERRRGLGAELLDGAIAILEGRAIGLIFLEVRESNQVAQTLYLSRGFRVVGLRAHYYERPREHALILQRELRRAVF